MYDCKLSDLVAGNVAQYVYVYYNFMKDYIII